MIVIKVEMWPLGDESKARTIATMEITNDGLGTLKRSNYIYGIYGKTRLLKCGLGYINNYPRQSYNVWELVRRILNDWKDKGHGK